MVGVSIDFSPLLDPFYSILPAALPVLLVVGGLKLGLRFLRSAMK